MNIYNITNGLFIVVLCAVTLVASGTSKGGFQTLEAAQISKKEISGKSHEISLKVKDGTALTDISSNTNIEVKTNDKGAFDLSIGYHRYSFSSDELLANSGTYHKDVSGIQNLEVTFTNKNFNNNIYTKGILFISDSQYYNEVKYGVATIGIRTNSSPESGEKTHLGNARFFMIDKNNANQLYYKSDVALELNFNTNKFSGNLKNIENAIKGNSIPGKLVIDNGKINYAGKLSADIAGDSAFNTYFQSSNSGDLQGDLYGPDGIETSAIFEISGSRYLGTGFFLTTE